MAIINKGMSRRSVPRPPPEASLLSQGLVSLAAVEALATRVPLPVPPIPPTVAAA